MRAYLASAIVVALAAGAIAQSPTPSPELAAAVASSVRSPDNVKRDAWRHPAQTLAFLGVTPAKRVVEFSPGGGWYTEILAALAKAPGSYTALAMTQKGADAATAMLAAKNLKGTVKTIDGATGKTDIAPASQDVVLTFRNIHNLTTGDGATNTFKAWFTMLKPGGTLGIVEHRLPEARDAATERTSGYMKKSTVVGLAEAAGFKLAGESEINANPKDNADHPKGVWTLPPTYQLKDVDRAKYAAIGESDRMTLKFVKPK